MMLLLLLLVCCTGANSAVSQSELSQIMQTIWDVDVNRYTIGRDIVLNLQGKASGYSNTDKAPSRLFSSVPNLSKKSTYKKFMALLDNYDPLTHVHDKSSSTEKAEQDTFINSIVGTNVWQETRRFLTTKGYVSSSLQLSSELHRIWFMEYSRAKGVTGSSGFEHVFGGELDSDDMKLSGLHNWISAYRLESARTVNYQGYLDIETENNLYEVKFRWGNYNKFGNSMFIGTSPEFEMAVYTICFLTRKDSDCQFTMNRRTLVIQTYSSYNGAIGTAYPKI